MTKTYDVKCFQVAAEFLGDEPHLHTVDRIDALAKIIQQTIEEFIAYEQENYEPPDPPGWEGGFADNH
jgi:hypothetical protein